MKVGDKVIRMLAGTIPMLLPVAKLQPDLITCTGGWTFDPATGAEIDEDLKWGAPPLRTGSFLLKINGQFVLGELDPQAKNPS